ncbi:hypothetical protein EH31_03935 [Erythrobacter longus]|uniref:TrbC/VIRB2 family protein n=2 Tax=Erythrobacter longus TaxID=1044 RepID=A0A074MIZ0_ERYLO|nr:hypothetical protein EH31_03935 [Erythrobacter longus]
MESVMLKLLAVQPSLFEPSGTSPLQGAAGWISELMQGPLVVTLCVIAVALVGFAALGGRLPVRMGARAVLGCFVVLGAPVIASALLWGGEEPSSQVVYQAENVASEPARPELPPADYDPYSGASLRRE